jgi:hypothetical protein
MSAGGHRWLGKWRLQRCSRCRAYRKSKGVQEPSWFSLDGVTWDQKAVPCQALPEALRPAKGGTEHPGTNPGD